MSSKVRIRAFRAVADYQSSMKFVDGHSKVLKAHGITKVTSLNVDWIKDPSVFVVLVESIDGKKVYGGARVHAASGKSQLPIELATGFMDEKVYDVVARQMKNGTGELCGLWNSIEVAGLGIGSFFSTRAGVVICSQIGLDSLFALCASYTVPWAEKVGCRVITEVGNNGTFYYPKIDLLATAVLLKDTNTLEDALPAEKSKILRLRKEPVQALEENSPGKNTTIMIDYDLRIGDVNPNEFKVL